MVRTQPIPCTQEEINAILNEARATNEFDYMLYMTLRYTGRRIGELYGLQDIKIVGEKDGEIEHIKIKNLDGTYSEVNHIKTRPVYKKVNHWSYGVQVKDIDFDKGIMKTWVLKRRNYIQDETILIPEVASLIRAYVKKNQLKLEDFVFRKVPMRTMQYRIGRYAKKCNINHIVSLHSFRHNFITELKRQGWANDEIRKLTGHKSAAVLSIYDHIVAEDLRDKFLEASKKI